LVGVGGGVVGDITGFVAAIYMRGIEFGLVPTTLLSMVDASIGGKNGINFGEQKNLVGTFNLPSFILMDYSFLNSHIILRTFFHSLSLNKSIKNTFTSSST
jgi:3-dehydroquinate synthase